jgi:O-methyltransferase involved in polyketide biosynthesis
MDLPASLTWIEADYPRVIDYKEGLLTGESPLFRLSRVKCDLANSVERGEMLARVDATAGKMLILTEGVIPYLSIDDVGALASELHTLKHAAYWIVDYLSPELLKFRRRMMADKMQNAPFKFQPDDWFGFFEANGWAREDMRYLGREGDRLGRTVQLPALPALITAVRGLFISKARRDRFKNAAGYALLVPR